ncbi:MAG: hypothetical protein FWH34_03700 [Desulfovibrionaceae bacterium]|nr:hypothetical protein [Desulfovibrionaceae bacterium]
MKKLLMTLCLFLCFAVPAQAAAPDAWVKGLWIKATGLPKGTEMEDMTEKKSEPYFLCTIGETPDGPAVSISIGRYPQNALATRLAKLDKKALAQLDGSQNFFKTAKNLKFTEVPKFSGKFSYPCQMASYTRPDTWESNTILFIQTDQYMFVVGVFKDTRDKKYTAADIEKWLMNLKMVEQ